MKSSNSNINITDDSNTNSNNVLTIINNDIDSNGWTEITNNTVNIWKKNCAEKSYIYELSMFKYLKRVKILDVITFTLSIIITSLSLFSTGFSESVHPEIYMTQKIVNILLSSVMSVTSGVPTILEWNSCIKKYAKYTEKVDGFLSIIISETTLPINLRKNGIDFIKQYKNTYYEIICNAPDIGPREYKHFFEDYSKYYKDRHVKWKDIQYSQIDV